MSISSNVLLNSFSEPIKLLPLPEKIVCTSPLLAIKHLNASMNESVSREGVISMCTAQQLMQVNCIVVLDLSPPVFYHERAKHVYSTERECWSLNNSTVGEVCHYLFNQSSTQPTTLYSMKYHLLDCCIPTYHPVTTASQFIEC